jgi:UDP-4-amino-4,6-dideoxy-N-acetyl-beta-L-altrosamine transaminase
MKKNIPYSRHSITKKDIDSVVRVLKSDFLTQGSTILNFEKNLKDFCNANYALATNSATSALHIACLALNIKEGDIVWTSAISFVASSNCALYCGAKIDFVDINIFDFNICIKSLDNKLTNAKKNKSLPKVLIVVHMAGQSSNMNEIYKLSQKYNFKIIEDASHAVGGIYNDSPVGSCKYSDITVLSFHPVKIITTGEGGMALTKSEEIYEKMLLLRSHGINKNITNFKNETHGDWYYEQSELGFNYRMTDIQAALGISQLKRINKFIQKRHLIADKYDQSLVGLPLKLPIRNTKTYSSFHLYVILVEHTSTKNRNDLFRYLREEKIGVNLHYIPIYNHPYYKQFNFNSIDFPNAEKYYQEAISIPIYFGLTKIEQEYIISKIKNFYTK